MDMDVGGTSISDGEGSADPANTTSATRSIIESAMGGTKLKRSSSAPMIHQLMPQLPLSAPPTPSPSSCDSSGELSIQPRMRRLSANFGPVSPLSPGGTRSSGRMRVCQLREEEGMDIVNREAAHEQKLHCSLTLSQSWEDLALSEDKKPFPGIGNKTFNELSLTIHPQSVSPQNSCAASPTRVGRQCFSPSLQQPIRNSSFCHTPSPTKKVFSTRRPISPVPLRPSALGGSRNEKWPQTGVKRKSDMEDSFLTPNKRFSGPSGIDKFGGMIISQSQSMNALESSPSPAGPVGTPDSICSSGSPGPHLPPYSPSMTPDPPPHCFKPVSPALTTASFGSNSDRVNEPFAQKPPVEDHTDEMITDPPLNGPDDSIKSIKSYQEMEHSGSLPPDSI